MPPLDAADGKPDWDRRFLGVPIPAAPMPQTNSTEEFRKHHQSRQQD